GRLKTTLQGHTHPVWTIAFSPDGKTIVTGSGPQILRSRFTGVGSEAGGGSSTGGGQLPPFLSQGGPGPVSSGEARLWDAASGRLRAILKGHKNPVLTAAFSPDGKTLATTSFDGARLWDTHSGQLKSNLPSEDGELRTLAFSPDGRWLATGGMRLRS